MVKNVINSFDEKKVNKIFLRFITFNRPKSIKRIISNINQVDKKLFSIQVFDNSTNEETFKVCSKFKSIEYIKTGSDIGFQKNYLFALKYKLKQISLENNFICILADDDEGHKIFLKKLNDVVNSENSFPSWYQLRTNSNHLNNKQFIDGKSKVIDFYKNQIKSLYIPCSLISDCIFSSRFLYSFFEKNKTYFDNALINNFPQTLLIVKIIDETNDFSIGYLDFNLTWVPQKKSGFSMYENYISIASIFLESLYLNCKETRIFLNWLSLSYCSWIIKNKLKKLFKKDYFSTNDKLIDALNLFLISSKRFVFFNYPIKYFAMFFLIILFFLIRIE